MFSSTKFLCLSLLAAAPVLSLPLRKRDVVDPPVLAPNASTVWYVGTTQTVVWDTSGLPPYNQITNRIGQVILGHLGGGGLNLMLNNPLAQGFNITQGSVDIIVPNVPPRTDYLIVLMGDSGNTSPTFAITSGSGTSTTSSSTSSSTTQTSSSSTSGSTPTPTTQTSSSSTSGSTPTSTDTSTSTAAPTITTVTGTGGGDQSTSNPTSPSAPPTTPMATDLSASTPLVSNTITSTLSSTTVVVQTTQPATTSTTTKANAALSMHHIGASCLTAALIISGLLI